MALLTELPSAKTRRLIIIGMVAAAAAVFAIAVSIYLSSPRNTDLPTAIQEIQPTPGSDVLSQQDITVDLAIGYSAELEINGVAIPESELFRAEALNLLSYQPQEGKAIERLRPDQNCVRVFYWLIASGDQDRQTYTWCFNAT